jgi:hypothetical protein
MQYILQEDEMKNYIHKDRLKIPLDEFNRKVTEIQKRYNIPTLCLKEEPVIKEIITELQTLNIKLQL